MYVCSQPARRMLRVTSRYGGRLAPPMAALAVIGIVLSAPALAQGQVYPAKRTKPPTRALQIPDLQPTVPSNPAGFPELTDDEIGNIWKMRAQMAARRAAEGPLRASPMTMARNFLWTGAMDVDVFSTGGAQYAIVAYIPGIRIYNISGGTSTAPVPVWERYFEQGAWKVVVNGTKAYVAHWITNELSIIDVSTPASASVQSTFTQPHGSPNMDLDAAGNYLYVAAAAEGLVIYNVSVPANPQYVATYMPNTGLSANVGEVRDVAASGGYVFLAYTGGWVEVVNATTASSPSYHAAIGWTGQQYFELDYLPKGTFHNRDVLVAAGPDDVSGSWLDFYSWDSTTQSFAYETNRKFALTYTILEATLFENQAYISLNSDGMLSLDITDVTAATPAVPDSVDITPAWDRTRGTAVDPVNRLLIQTERRGGVRVKELIDGTTPLQDVWQVDQQDWVIHTVRVEAADRLFVANGFSGLVAYDISDPANPTVAHTTGTSGEAVGLYVDLPYIYVADGTAGVSVFSYDSSTGFTGHDYNPVSSGYANHVMLKTFGTGAWKYLYVAQGADGIVIVDVSDPDNIIEVGSVTMGSDSAWWLATFEKTDQLAVAKGAAGATLYDISFPTSPSLVDGFTATDRMWYVGGDEWETLILSDDANLEAYDLNTIPPTYLGDYFADPGSYRGIEVLEGTGYLAAGWDGVRILNVSDPASMYQETSLPTAGFALHATSGMDYTYISDQFALVVGQFPGDLFLDLAPLGKTLSVGGTTTFTASGGTSPYDYWVEPHWLDGRTIATINATTGALTAVAAGRTTVYAYDDNGLWGRTVEGGVEVRGGSELFEPDDFNFVYDAGDLASWIYVPQNTFDGPVEVEMRRVDIAGEAPAPPAGFEHVRVYDLTGTWWPGGTALTASDFNNSTQLVIHYDDTDLPPGTVESTTVIKRWNSLSSTWEDPPFGINRDPGNNKAITDVNQFSYYSVLVTESPAPDIFVYEPSGIHSGDIKISYVISDSDSSNVGLLAEYSPDAGATWFPATVSLDTFNIAPADYDSSLIWDTGSDLPGVRIFNVPFRITPYDTTGGTADQTVVDVDNLIPQWIGAAGFIGDDKVRFWFNEPVSEAIALNAGNYWLSLGLPVASVALQDRWQGAAIVAPTDRQYPGAGIHRQNIYVVGGRIGGSPTNVVEFYRADGTWQVASPMPTAREWPSVLSLENKVYVLGGSGGGNLNTLEMYDPAIGTWTARAGAPVYGSKFVNQAVVHDGRIYVHSGADARIYRYDPHTDSWEDYAPSPTTNVATAMVRVNDLIYIIGGEDTGGNKRSDTFVFDPATGLSTLLSPMTTARSQAVAQEIDEKIYVIGGNGSSGALSVVEVYDTSTDTWSTGRAAPVASNAYIGGKRDNRIYFGQWGAPDLRFYTYLRDRYELTIGNSLTLPNQDVDIQASNILDYYNNGPATLLTTFTPTSPDAVPPPAPDTIFPNGTNASDWQSMSDFLLDLDWSVAGDDPSGILRTYYKLDSAPTGSLDTTATFPGDIGTVTATLEGGQDIYVWSEDGQGNLDYVNNRQGTLRYDATAMTAPTSLTANGASPSPWTANDSFSLEAVAPPDASGVLKSYYRLGAAPTANADTTGSFDLVGPYAVSTGGGTPITTAYLWLIDQAGNENYSNVATVDLRLDQTGPTDPTLSSPGSGATVTAAQPTFTWAGSSDGESGVGGYEFAIFDDAGFTNLIESQSGDPTFLTFTLSNTLTDGSYWWRVRAQDAAGNYSNWAQSSFTATIATFAAPTLVSPVGGAYTNVQTDLPLEWNAVAGAIQYNVEVATDPGFAPVDIYVSGTDDAPPAFMTFNAADQMVFYWRVQAGDGTSFGPWSATGTFVTDFTPPSVTVQSLPAITVGQPVTITADVTDNGAVGAVELFYRRVGEPDWMFAPMPNTSGNTYQRNIPGAAVGMEGFQYFVGSTDGAGNISLATASGVPSIGSYGGVTLNFGSLPAPSSVPANRWMMVSVPHRPGNSNINSLLQGVGGYDNTVWRFFQWVNNSYSERSNADLQPGRAYWLHHRATGVRMDVGAGTTVASGQDFPLTLTPGWNDIASPWLFSVPWDSVLVATGPSSSNLVGTYTYSGGAWRNPTVGSSTVPPWQGVTVYNRSSSNISLRIPPVDVTAVAATMAAGQSGGLDESATIVGFNRPATEGRSGVTPGLRAETDRVPAQRATADPVKPEPVRDRQEQIAGGWSLQLILTQEGATGIDSENYVGVHPDARNGYDSGDYPDPPMSLEGTARLSVDHSTRGQDPGYYATDYQAPGQTGYVWDLQVESIMGAQVATLRPTGMRDLPDGTVAALLDVRANLRIDLDEQANYRFYPGSTGGAPPTDGRLVRHALRVIVGSPAFVDGLTMGATRLPGSVDLEQNFPNPFNPITTIRFTLNEPTRVRLTILNVRGQRVRQLADGLYNAGPHTLQWDGRDAGGRQVASGIYFYRLEAGSHVRSKKMTLIR